MDGNARLNCQVRLLDKNGSPVGCGFICDDQHVMTCTHVIDSCLKDAVDREFVECRFKGAPRHHAKLRVIKSFPFSDSGDERDITVLELAPGSTFHPDFSSVSTALTSLEEHMEYVGTGIRAGFPDIQIEGKTGERDGPSRVFVAGFHQDQTVQPGCSGAAIFHKHDGLLGMIVEVQQTATGFIIPIQILRKAWPIRASAGSSLPGLATDAAITKTAEPLNKRMLRAFSDFDRHDQSADFRDAFNRKWDQSRSAMICAIAGLEDDVPRHCRDKFRNTDLKGFLRRDNLGSSKIDALEISWPHRERRFDVERVFKRMQGVLAGYIQAPGTTPQQVRETLNNDLRQLIFYSQLDQRTFGKNHFELLQKWAAYFYEIDDEPLDRPLIHFLIIRLDPADFQPSSEEPNAMLARFYRDLIARTNRQLPAGSEIESTALLNCIEIDFIDNWIGMNSEKVGLDDQLVEDVRDNARQAFPEGSYIRLKNVGDWMKSLAG